MKIVEFINKNKFLIIAVLIIAIIIAAYYIRDYRASKVLFEESSFNDDYTMVPKTYGVNEYTSVNISNDTMSKIYFNDYKSLMSKNIEEAYLKLDSEYKQAKFPTIDSYRNYVAGLNVATLQAKKYRITDINGYLIYIVYDNMDNYYAFKTNGVLQYSVYLDDKTVEIR